jgi:ethanolamine ammonia-lyase small subunit
MSKTAAIVTPADEVEIAPPIDLKEMTDARVALGRFGAGLPTRATQSFLLDHARAREAVWSMVDRENLAQRLQELGLPSVLVESRAADRSTYVRRPDLGRQLSDASRARLEKLRGDNTPADITIVVADGLSSSAVETNAVVLIELLSARLGDRHLTLAPVVLVEQGRVALGDPIGEALRTKLTIMLIGERPGLSAADSLGAYITYTPKTGTPDSKRNCISNIRDGGLSGPVAAQAIVDLVMSSMKTGVSGVALKDAVAALT